MKISLLGTCLKNGNISACLRKRIAKAVDGGLSRNKASKRFDVAVMTVVNLMNHVKETGNIAPKKIGGY